MTFIIIKDIAKVSTVICNPVNYSTLLRPINSFHFIIIKSLKEKEGEHIPWGTL